MNARTQADFTAVAKQFTAGNPAPYETLEQINARTAVIKGVKDELLAMGDWPVPLAVSTFNDDDVYIYEATSKKLVKHLSCSDQQVKDAKYIGLRVMAGQTWAKGMTAKTLSLWKSA